MTQFSDYADKYQGIRFTREDGVLEMALHTRGGPAKWGSSPDSLHTELPDAFLDIARDPENRVVILTGTGSSFIDDLDPTLAFPEPSLAHMWQRIYGEGIGLLNNLLAIPMPMIAAVNGPALIHAELAVLCDIVLAADHAEFADLAHAVNGTVPGDGVHAVWPMLLGPNRGRYFLLTGERIQAGEAQRLGFVAEVLPPAKLLARARDLARQIARRPIHATRFTRSLLVRELQRRIFDELPSGLAHEALGSIYRSLKI